MANEHDEEQRRLKAQADANAKAALAAKTKQVKVLEDMALEGMHKQQLATQRPQQTQALLDYEQRQRDEAIREGVRERARANFPADALDKAKRDEHQKAHEAFAASLQQKQASQAAVDGAAAQVAAVKRAQASAQAKRQQQPSSAGANAKEAAAKIVTAQEAARLRRAQQEAAVEKRDRDLKGQNDRRTSRGAERFDPMRENTDRRVTATAREGARETSDRAAQQQNRALTTEDTEQRHSRRNNGAKRDREQEM